MNNFLKYLLTAIIFFLIPITSLEAKHKHFKVSYDPDFAPYSYIEDDKPYGLLIDYWKLWAQHNHYEITFINAHLWDDALDMAKEGKVDFFLGTEVYETWMKGSKPFYEDKSVFFKLKQTQKNFDNEPTLTIGLIGSDLKESVLEYYPYAKVIVYDEYDSSIKALLTQKIDLLFDVKTAVEFYALQNRLFHKIEALSEFEERNDIQAISKSQKKITLFNKGMKNIPYEALKKLDEKWILNKSDYFYNKNNIYSLNFTQEEQHFIDSITVKSAFNKNSSPFSFQNNQYEYQGLSIDFWNLILQKSGLKDIKSAYDKEAIMMKSMVDKSSDIILSAEKNISQDKTLYTSDTYISLPIALSTLKDENIIMQFKDISNKKLAIVQNSLVYSILKNEYPKMKFIFVPNIKKGLELVENKKVFAAIDSEVSLNYHIRKFDFQDLKISGHIEQNLELNFIIKEDYKLLGSIINKTIKSIDSVEKKGLVHKWNNVEFEKRFDYDLFIKISVVITIVFIILLYRSILLKRMNINLEKKVENKTKELQNLNTNLEVLVELKSIEVLEKEKILQHQSKMATMGELLQNIAHQWRQPLSVIVGEASGIKYQKEHNLLDDENLLDSIKRINTTAIYLSDTIEDFKNYFSKHKQESHFSLKKVLNKALSLYESNSISKNIKIIKNIEDVNLFGFENELIQVILNLLNNSMDALKTLENNKDNIIVLESTTNDNHVFITIKDSAGGIADDIIEKVFEPYFTTKLNNGTGIGLYMSYEIVTTHMNGEISVHNVHFEINNTPYQGAEFTIKLPKNK